MDRDVQTRAGRRSWAFARSLLVVVVVVGVLGGPLATAFAHEDGAGSQAEVPELTKEQQARVERLFGIVVCACPKENWTRTLAGCANNCADPQKNQIRKQVLEGWTDDQILEAQAKEHGPKAIGRTSAEGVSGFLVYGGPFLLLAAFLVAVILLLKRLTRELPTAETGVVSAAAASTGRPSPTEPSASTALAVGAPSEEDRALGDEIDRELAEMD